MDKELPANKKKNVRKIIFERADAIGYTSRSRTNNGRFMDELVDDPEIGGVLKEYMPKDKVRTYIKDGVLNAYMKAQAKKNLASKSATDTVAQLYSTTSDIIQECKDLGVVVCRSGDGCIFVVSEGTVIKWETALRKALELIAREPNLIINGKIPSICLHLAVTNHNITDGDRKHITTALKAISVKARFCCD